MPKNQEMDKTTILIRVDKHLKTLLEAQSKLEGTTISELVRNALTWYLHKDVHYKGQVEGSIESVRGEVLKIKRELEMLSSMFIFWTRFFFAYQDIPEPTTEEEGRIRMLKEQKGMERSEEMLKIFKSEIKDFKPGLIESIIADYVVMDKN